MLLHVVVISSVNQDKHIKTSQVKSEMKRIEELKSIFFQVISFLYRCINDQFRSYGHSFHSQPPWFGLTICFPEPFLFSISDLVSSGLSTVSDLGPATIKNNNNIL